MGTLGSIIPSFTSFLNDQNAKLQLNNKLAIRKILQYELLRHSEISCYCSCSTSTSCPITYRKMLSSLCTLMMRQSLQNQVCAYEVDLIWYSTGKVSKNSSSMREKIQMCSFATRTKGSTWKMVLQVTNHDIFPLKMVSVSRSAQLRSWPWSW